MDGLSKNKDISIEIASYQSFCFSRLYVKKKKQQQFVTEKKLSLFFSSMNERERDSNVRNNPYDYCQQCQEFVRRELLFPERDQHLEDVFLRLYRVC